MATSTNVSASKPKVGGAIYTAPVGSTLPTDASSALDAAFKDLGYISDAGLANSNSRSSDDIKAFGGDIVLSTVTETKDTFKMTLIEALNVDVLKTIFGNDNVTGDLETGLTVKVNSGDAGLRSYVFEIVLNNNTVKRIVIPNASISELGDTTYADGSVIGYEVTLTAFPDTNGNKHYEYILQTQS